LQIFKFRHLKTGPEHETVGIFATLHGQKTQKPRYCCLFWHGVRILAAQKWPGARDCWHFWHFALSKNAEATFFFVFLNGDLEKTHKNTTKRIRRPTFCNPLGETRTKRTLGRSLYEVPRGSKTSPQYETVGIFATFRCENGPEHETVDIFAIFKCESGPEHETVGIFSTSGA
jgi:hypothetical protein